ncbi:MAG: GDP-mannose 4,6-dehydratase, partial [Gammaproteobacteria bacterium]
MNKRILVTGGLGFIGSAFIRNVIKNSSNSILNLDKTTYAADMDSKEEFDNYSNYSFKKVDICDYSQLKESVDKFEPNIVFHFAAESHVDNSISKPLNFLQTNIIGTYNLLNIFQQKRNSHQSDDLLFMHISTDEVFGSLQPEEEPFTETSQYKPNSPYSATKASSDHLVRAWGET